MNLREKRARLFEENSDLLEAARSAGRPLTAEELAEYDRRDAEIEEISKTIEAENRQLRTEEALDAVEERAPRTSREPGATGDEDPEARFSGIFGRYLRGGMRGLSHEEQDVLDQRLSAEARAQASTPGAAGGFLIPQGFRNTIIETMKAFGGIQNLAETLDTDTGNALLWPTSNETAAEGQIINENTAVTELDVALGQASLGAYLYTSRMVKVSRVLLQDSAFNLERWLGTRLGQRIARIQARHLAVGTGTGEPQGLVTGAPIGVTLPVGNATSLTYEGIVDLIYAIDPAYRPRARFVVGDRFVQAARKIKDANNLPVWQPGMVAGQPDQLLGYPLSVDYGMAAPAANAITAVFGDIAAAYVVRTVLGIEVMRLDERFAELGQVAFLGWARMDARVQDSAAVAALRHSAS